MSEVMTWLGWALVSTGLFFFLTSAVGLSRFPDFYSRLHAVTKADNSGLGFLAAGLALLSQDLHNAAILAVIWLLVMAAGTTSCQLLARYQVEQDDP